MRLPNPDRAIVDMRKLRDYCLSTDHPRGRHKARVFARTLGFTSANAEELRDLLLTAARTWDAIPADADAYGQRHVVDLVVNTLGEDVTIRSTWIVRTGEDFPRLTSCYVR